MNIMERHGWVSPACCGLLVLSLWLQASAAGTVGVDSADDVWADGETSPCLGEKCKSGKRILKEDDDDALLRPLPRGLSPRAKRQTVVVEDGGKSHRLPCTLEEEKQTACLNGKCYAVDMADLRSPACACPAKFEGKRCELLSMYYFTAYYARLKKGAIIGGVVVGIILIIVAVSIYCSYRKGRRKRDRPLCCCCTRGAAAPKPERDAMVSRPDGAITRV